MKKSLVLTVTIGTLLSSIADVQAASFIDEFSSATDNLQKVEAEGVGTIFSSLNTGLDKVIGGSRFLELENTFDENPLPTGISSLTVDTRTNEFGEALDPATFNKLSWSNAGNVVSKATVTWDANEAGLDLDLTEKTGIKLKYSTDVPKIVAGPEITWTLMDGIGNSAVASTEINETGTVRFEFDTDFMVDAGFDFTDVDKISLMLDGGETRAIDASFKSAWFDPELPEPGAVLGLFGVTVLARCLKRKDKDKE